MAAASGVTVASVWLDVLPSMKNFGTELTQGVEKETAKTGKKAGEDLGENTKKGLKGKAAGLAAVGAGVGLAVAGAIVQAMDIQSARAKLSAQLGLSTADAARYGKVAGQVYAGNYGESLDQVNEALVNVNRNIGANLNDADLSKITSNVLNLSSTFDVDLTGATAAVGQMMKTGLAPDAQSAFDVITAGFQHGVDKAGDFLDTLNEYGTQFRKLGLDGQTATGLLSQGLQAGARDADLVADAIKEFSIRAVDGSTTTAAGFKAIGVDAKAMSEQIAAGGPAAEKGLDTVLDRLRAIKDPVMQGQAAVALFGTQAEDLGAALYALDPSKAVDALGQVAGAADAMDKTLSDTASARLASFQRTLQMSLVDFLGGTVLPILDQVSAFGSQLFGAAWEPVKGFLGFLAGTGGVVIGVIIGIAGAVKLWAIAQEVLNLAMFENPITWVVLAIVGLIAVVIWAWNNFEGFRTVVTAVFSALGTAVSTVADFFVWLWQSVIVPAAQAIGAVFTWLWQNVLSPIFTFIWTAIKVLAAIIFVILVAPALIAIHILGAIFTWLWEVAIQPAFTAIGALAQWLWANVLQPVWIATKIEIQALGAFFTWLWVNAVQPALSAIGAFAQWLWVSAIQPVWQAIQVGLQVLGAVFNWLWVNAVQPALSAIGTAASVVWQGVLRPVFDAIGKAAGAVGDAFGWAVDKIRDVWGRIQGIVRPPVQFVVDVVYNHGIAPAWNAIAGIFGLGTLPVLAFASGGLVPGYAPGKDRVPALLSPGEAVLVPEAVRMLGAANVLALNHTARTRAGRSSSGTTTLDPRKGDLGYLGDYDGVQRFADGGIVGWLWDRVVDVGSFVGGIAEFIADPEGSMRRVFAAVAGGNGGAGGQLAAAIAAFPVKVIDGAIGWVKKFIADNVPDGNYGGALAWAKTQVGLPYVWGGGGGSGWDCSGFMAGITKVIRGETPGRIGTTASMPWPGFKPGAGGLFSVGVSTDTGDGIGHMAGTLLGTNVESYGGHGPAVGSGARGTMDGLFPSKYTFVYDEGGYLPPGWSQVYNGTSSPEPVLTSRQWDAVANGTQGGDSEELVLTSGRLEIGGDGLARIVDGRVRRVTTALGNGRRT